MLLPLGLEGHLGAVEGEQGGAVIRVVVVAVVEEYDDDGDPLLQPDHELVFVEAGAEKEAHELLQSPRLLLQSRSPRHPDLADFPAVLARTLLLPQPPHQLQEQFRRLQLQLRFFFACS